MKISREFVGGALIVSLSGELDHHGAKEMMTSVAALIEEHVPRSCVLELGGVDFMDSSGIALILNVNKKLGSIGGRLLVENVNRQPMKVIRASGIERIVNIKELKA